MKRVVLDANFLVLPFQFNVEIFDEIDRLCGENRVFTLERALNEALNLRDGRYHALVKKLMDVKDIQILRTPADQPVDTDLLKLGRRGFIVCTNDSELKSRLDEENLPHIYLRQKNHLEAKNLKRF